MSAEWTEDAVRQQGFWSPAGDEPTWRSVPGFVRGPWGLSPEPSGHWNLTHTPTGASVGWFRRRVWAEHFAAALERLPIDWTGVRFENIDRLLMPHRHRIERLKGRPSFRFAPATEQSNDYVRRLKREATA